MASFIARWFTPSKSTPAFNHPPPKKAPAKKLPVKGGAPAKTKTRTKYAGGTGKRTKEEADVARKTLLGS